LAAKWQAFGWDTHEIDGHDFGHIISTVGLAKARFGSPMIIANTVKGKGVPFMEQDNTWHGTPPNQEQFERALREIEKVLDNETPP
jgi:transketolase